MNRPRPTNGSGDSPRPPFLTEFVNRIGKLALVEAVYHLFGGQPRLRIHPHIQGPFRLKTESSRCVLQLHGTDTQVGQHSVCGCCRHMLGHLCEGGVYQLNLRPVTRQRCRRLRQSLARPFQRCRVFIEADETTLCAETPCYFASVPRQSEGQVDKSPAAPNGQEFDRWF